MIRILVVLAAAASLAAQTVDQYLTGIAEGQWKARAARVAALSTPAQVAERQKYIRAKMLEEIGGFPAKTPLNPRITGTLERTGYRVEKLIYESRPHFYVTANLYVPEGAGPFPAVLGTAGHSDSGKAYPLYQRTWIGLAKRGFVVLAYDPPAQGERSEYADLRPGVPQHIMAGEQCLLAGSNIASYEIWDGIRAVDYLLTRKEVDAKRIAVIGNSGGGTQSAYLAVFEPRLAAAVPSCYITGWEQLWSGPGPQDSEQVFDNFLADGFDFGDFLIAFAPKPIQMLTAIRDFFPIAGGRATFAEVERVFQVTGHRDRVGYFEYDDQHGWSKPRREATYRWLEKWLHGREDAGTEPEFETEPETGLNCTPEGRAGGETVYTLNRAYTEKVFATRKALKIKDPGKLRALVAARLRMPAGRGAPELAEGARLHVPEEGAGRKPALISIDGGESVPAGRIVVSIETTALAEGKSGYDAGYQRSMRAILVGETLPGIYVQRVLRTFDYLLTRPDVDPARIAVEGNGNGAVIALLARALEPRFEKTGNAAVPQSYMEIVRAQVHGDIASILIPGVLRDFDLPDLEPLLR